MTGAGRKRRRAGTEDIVSIAGFASAAEIACEELADREMVRFLRDGALSAVLGKQHPPNCRDICQEHGSPGQYLIPGDPWYAGAEHDHCS